MSFARNCLLVSMKTDSDQIGQEISFSARGGSQFGNENEVLEFESTGDDLLAQQSQVIAVSVSNLFDQTVQAQALQEARDLAAGYLAQQSAQALVLEAPQVELSSCQGFNQSLVFGGEEVQAPRRAVVFPHRLADLPQTLNPRRGVVQSREKFQVTPVGGHEHSTQSGQAVDTLLHRRPPGDGSPVPLLYRAVALKKGNVVYGDLDSQNLSELVVHLDRDRSHGVFDPRAFDAGVEPVAHLPLVERAELATQEGGEVVGLGGVDGGAREMAINRLQVFTAAEDQVGRELDLIQTPVIAHLERADHRTIALRPLVQLAVQPRHRPGVSDFLRALEIFDLDESVVPSGVADLLALETAGQAVMPIEINLQAERAPGGDADVAQPQFLIDEIKVVVQALTVVGAQVRLARGLVLPGTLAVLLQHLMNLVLLAEALGAADEFDLQPVLSRQLLGVRPQRLAQRLRPLRGVKDADVTGIEIPRHPFGITEAGQRALNLDSEV